MILRIGHRGAMGHEPENTLISFQKALDLGVGMIEFDCLRAKTGEAVVFHDDKLKRLSGQKGFVREKTLAQLKGVTLAKGQRIPTIEEALDTIDRKALVNIELKGRLSLKPALKAINHYVNHKGWAYEDFLLSSFIKSKMRQAKKLLPQVPRAALASVTTTGLLNYAHSIQAYSININKKLAKKPFIEKAQHAGFKVYVWTVNDPEEIVELKTLGVDGIFSDFPERV